MEHSTVKSEVECDTIEEMTSTRENDSTEDRESDYMTPKRIYRNVLVISFVFFLTFVSYGGLAVLQSSLHRVDGMGTATQSVLNACSVISCLFLPKLATQKLGHKHCVVVSMVGYIVWMAANGYAVWWTMVPASMVVGVCCGPFWAAASSYITILSEQYAESKGQRIEHVLPNFFGIFLMMGNISGLFGSVISSTVLRQSPPENFTGPSEEDLALCGINDCPGNNVTSNINLQKPAENLVWTLVGIYIGIAVIGLITCIVCLDSIPTRFLKNRKKSSVMSDLQATFRQLVRPKQLLLTPLSIYMGLFQAFKVADWNESFVACNLGIWMVGYTNIAYYTSLSAMAYVGGKIVRARGFLPVYLVVFFVDIGLYLTYIFWTPNSTELVLFFVLPVLSGMTSGIWRPQISAYYGFVFSDNSEAAFSTLLLYISVGSFLGFGYSSQLCTIYKLYILFTGLLLGVLCFCVVEWKLWVEKSKAKRIETVIEN